MKIKVLIGLLICITMPHLSFAQWTDHLFLGNGTYSGFVAGRAYAANNSGIFVYNFEDKSLAKYTKINHLSDLNISTVGHSDKELFVGYANGNIDIVDLENYSTINIPELKNANLTESKRINSFYHNGQYLYCSTDCGLIVIDLNKREIKSRYKLLEEGFAVVNGATVVDNTIYAATNAGILHANAKSNILESHNEWRLYGSSTAKFSSIIHFDNKIIASEGSLGGSNNIMQLKNNTLNKILTIGNFRNFSASADQLLITNNQSIRALDKELQTSHTLSKFTTDGETLSHSLRFAEFIDEYSFAAVDYNLGLIISDLDGESTSILPNSPANNFVHKIIATNNGIYCTGGGLTSSYNNLNRRLMYHYFNDNTWTTTTRADKKDAVGICYDKNAHDSVYVSSWGNGVFKVVKDTFVSNYNSTNSLLQDIYGGMAYTRTNAIGIDDNSNLFIANSAVNPGMVVKTKDDEWYPLSYFPINSIHSTKEMIFTSNGNGWVIMPRANKGFFVFNTNGTIDDDTDDMYRSCLSQSEDGDSRNRGQLKVIDNNGEVISDNVYSIVEDKKGLLWIGTDDGIVTFSGDKNLFTTATPYFNRIKVPRNDGTNSADYLLGGTSVTTIAVDGANRKWVGTMKDGVFLLSEDGLTTIHSFDINNSPLISNEINSIAIAPSGEVFIGTALGIVSYKGNVLEPYESLSKIKAYPNPVRPTYNGMVTIKGFTHDCPVRITDINGRMVYETKSLGGVAQWDGKRYDGARVSSGTYLIWASLPTGEESVVCKILVVR